MKTPDDYARRAFELWMPTGERLMGSYVNAFGELRELIGAQVVEAVTAALEDASKATCEYCKAGIEVRNEGVWSHPNILHGLVRCDAAAIRAMKEEK